MITPPKHSGLFWTPEIKATKQPKAIPHPYWLEPGYLPEGKYEEVEMMTDEEIRSKQGTLICDIELYPNYFLAAFMSVETGKCIVVEEDMEKLNWILHNYAIVTFNGNNFDLPILALAVAGKSIEEMKYAADMIIVHNVRGWDMLKHFGVPQLEIDHIDLIEVAPLSGSLKIYGGRLHVPRMQDLPFSPDSELTEAQIDVLRNYCVNDLVTTAFVYANLEEQIGIRIKMSDKYGIDLRSKSDAQVAEAVIKAELTRMGAKPQRPNVLAGRSYQYNIPKYIKYNTPVLITLLNDIRKARFVLNEGGKIIAPKELIDPSTWGMDTKKKKPRKFELFGKTYAVGIGGLHSCESSVSYRAENGFKIKDFDVTSYYPECILNQNLYPEHLGMNFLNVYRSLVSRRIKAKKEGNKIEADMLKIVVNGSFGKFGSKWSTLYAPQLMIQTTLTGQLSILMLIEQLNAKGIEVLSGNTDGVVMRYPEVMEPVVQATVAEWEKQTGFKTEETEYIALFSRDVNCYVAVKPDHKAKLKGVLSNPWNEKGAEIFRFHKNPTNSICIEAVVAYLTKGIPLAETIRNENDFTKFVTVRAVKGGAVKDKTYLGKAIRWYYSKTTAGEIVYAKNGNKVPKSENAQPCMELPENFPDDVDYVRYELEALEILKDINAI